MTCVTTTANTFETPMRKHDIVLIDSVRDPSRVDGRQRATDQPCVAADQRVAQL